MAFDWRDLGLSAPQAAAAAMHGSPPIPRFDWAALAPVTGSVKADNLTLDLTGTFKNIGPLVVSNALTINAAKGIDNSNASIHTGTLNINSHDGWLNNTNGQINAQSFKADIAGQLNNNQGKISVVGDAYLKTGDVVATNGSFKSTSGNFTLDSAGNITMTSSHLDASGDLTVKAQGKVIIDSAQTYTRTQTGSDVRQSLQTERSSLTAQGNVTVFGKQSVQMDATDVEATNGKASVRSEGNVSLGFNTDNEQHNWTTSSTRRSAGGLKKKTTTTQHETQDKTAEVTRITGNQVEVRGQNVASFGAEFNGTELVHVEGVDLTLLYDVKEEKTTQANSRTTRSFGGISYQKSTSTDTTLERQALGTELISDKAIRLGVGSVTDLRGAVLDAPTIDVVRSEGADTSQPGQLILGASVNTSQTSHTEKTTTAGVWQKQAGHGSTTQTANQTQVHGEMSIDESIQTTVQLPDVVSTSGKQPNASAAVGTVAKGTAEAGSTPQPASTPVAQSSVQSQIDTLSQQPGLGYLSQLQNNPNVNWSQIQLAKDQWNYSQQGLTPAGAALLAIAIAVYTGGMGAELLGTTTSAAGAAGAAGASTTALAGTTLATTTAATATVASVTTYTAAGAALNAGFTSLVTTAGISFVNNGGDIGKTFKDLGDKDNVKGYVLSMATAGGLHMLGDTLMIEGKKLNDITPKNSNFGTNFGKNLVNNFSSAVINSAVTGTSLEDNVANVLLNTLVDTASGQAAVAIGGLTVPSATGQPPKLNAAGQAFAHALAGCIAGAIKAGEQGCQSGAVGAVVGETAAQWFDPTGNRPRSETLGFARIVSAFAGAVTGDGSAQSVNIAADAGVNAAGNNWLAHAEAKRKSDLEYLQLTGNCDNACLAELKQLQALDESRNKKLKDCQGSVTPDCQKARQDVRNAAAEYIRLNAKDTGMNFTYANEKQETLSLSQQTMGDYTVWNIVKGAAESTVDGLFGMAKAGYEGFKAVFGDEKAQEHVAQWPGAAWDFIKDPNNWPQLMGAMSPENREKLAKAYESGDGKTAAAIMGENYSNLPVGGGMGTIKKVTGATSKLDNAAALLNRTDVDKVVEVPAGSRGNWDPTINTGTTGTLAPRTAYMLDNGHTYVTDGSGRVKEVTGNLSPNKMDRNEYQQGCAGRSGCAGDDGGHLIASSLGGAGDRINIVPQASTLNRQDWKVMENFFRSELEAGKTVNVKIDVGYPASGGVRPSEFRVLATINGVTVPFRFTQ